MKKFLALATLLCLLLAGCGEKVPDTQIPDAENTDVSAALPTPTVSAAPAAKIHPLPDTTMEELTEATLSVSLEAGDVYVDDSGILQMNVKIYTYDLYDSQDIAQLKEGDIFVTHAGEVEVTSMERSDHGSLCINGGLDKGGMELIADGGGTFSETGFNDIKSWYEIGTATLRVSVDFIGHDNADPDLGEIIIYPGDFLIEDAVDYHFTPHNTTIRLEGGQVVELNRRYTP